MLIMACKLRRSLVCRQRVGIVVGHWLTGALAAADSDVRPQRCRDTRTADVPDVSSAVKNYLLAAGLRPTCGP